MKSAHAAYFTDKDRVYSLNVTEFKVQTKRLTSSEIIISNMLFGKPALVFFLLSNNNLKILMSHEDY